MVELWADGSDGVVAGMCDEQALFILTPGDSWVLRGLEGVVELEWVGAGCWVEVFVG